MRLPVNVVDLAKSGRQIQKDREKPVRIALFVEPDAPDALLAAAQAAFRPFTAGARLHIEVAEPDVTLIVDPSADAVVALAGSCSRWFAASLAAARDRAIPTAVVAMAEDTIAVADALGHPYRDTIASPDEIRAVEVELGEWLVERLSDKRLALAHNFAFMRRAVAVEHVKNTAMQNALIGVVAVLPGTDMPIMTANQAKMVLQIAAAYGEEIGAQRVRELLPVLGGGYVFRTAARQVAALVPGFGWAVKGGIAYSGTIAMGFAAIRLFEHGAELGDLEERLKAYGNQAVRKLRSFSRKEAAELAAQQGIEVPSALPAALPAASVGSMLPAPEGSDFFGPGETPAGE